MQIQSRSFSLPAPVIILTPSPTILKIKYYTDCVFNPIAYEIGFKVVPLGQGEGQGKMDMEEKEVVKGYRIQMDFGFLTEATKEHPRILDNIGMINIWYQREPSLTSEQLNPKDLTVQRFGVLVTNENESIYISLIQ